jgi:nitrogen fixation protein NifU and related proteins
MYSKKLIEHFKKPANSGEIADADSYGEARNSDNGNYVKMWIKVNADDIIEDIKYKTVGCVPAIAAGSVLTGLAKGRSTESALKLGIGEVLTELGGLAPDKIHTIKLALDALKDAIGKYKLNCLKQVSRR